MTIISRPYNHDDYGGVRQLLIDSLAISGRIHNWWLDRFDGTRYSSYAVQELSGVRAWEKDLFVWELPGEKIVGVVNWEGKGELFLQIHPHYRQLEDEMLAWGEQHHLEAINISGEKLPLTTYAYAYDRYRFHLLTRRGYTDLGPSEHTRWRQVDAPIPPVNLPSGYTVRAIRPDDWDDLTNRAAVNNHSFGSANNTAETVKLLQSAPSYRPDLDLVAVAPDGRFASFCIAWYGPENQIGWFEPVGTHPEHRRLGLASAVISEGLRRLRDLGARAAYIGSGYQSKANRLYEALGFTNFETWHRFQLGMDFKES